MSDQAKNLEIEVDDDLELEIIDDTPEEDKGRPRRADDQDAEIPDDDEIASYSGNVQSRIKKLKFEFHEERRRKEEAQRLSDQAIHDMNNIYQENQKLKATLTKGEGALVGQAKARVNAQLDQAKRTYKEAYEAGDSDAMMAANEALTKLTHEKMRFDSYRPRQGKQQAGQKANQQAPAQQQQARQQEAPQVDKKALEWSENNSWFQKDKSMTGFAYGVHEDLIDQGVNPSSDEYYERIDERMREAFPNKFGQQRQGAVVAPATRSSKSPRKVRLTQSQVALAKRLGISPEAYAAQMLKEMRQ
mgnify:FL=1|tara:strand:+ start:1395 stop:2303 length:909 start_codon:yes stop_codon:yes gene_type:complete